MLSVYLDVFHVHYAVFCRRIFSISLVKRKFAVDAQTKRCVIKKKPVKPLCGRTHKIAPGHLFRTVVNRIWSSIPGYFRRNTRRYSKTV